MYLLTYSSKILVRSLVLVVCLAGIACSGGNRPSKDEMIARYKNEVLLRDELDYHLPAGMLGEDSIRFAEKYIEDWLISQAVAEAAVSLINNLDQRIDFKLKNFKNHLVNHEFTEYLITRELNTLVSEEEIRNYYEKNPDKFRSKANYFSFFHIKVDNTNDYYRINAPIRSNDPDKIEELAEWAKDNALEYRLDSAFVTDAEIERVSKGFYYGSIKRSRVGVVFPYSSTEDGKVYYNYFKLLNAIKPGEMLTLELCKDRIVDIILNQRKSQLIERREKELIQQATSENKIVIF